MDIAFPLQFDSRGRTASAGLESHVSQMLEELIFTNPGERVNRPDFGTPVSQLLFAPNSPELAATVQFTVQAAIQRWLGDLVDIREVSVSAVESTLTITIVYAIRSTAQQQTVTLTRPV
jgi:phage baseplate assembly protein W